MRIKLSSLKFIFILAFLSSVFSVQAQSVKELEAQRKKTLQKLEITSKLLDDTKKSQKSSLNKLTLINKNIKERKALISNINSEIGQLDNEMQKLNNEKRMLENRLKSLKNDYAKLVQEAHINRSMYTKIMFVLSANTFDQSYRRLRYLQEYSDYRKQQVQEIQKVTTQIAQKNDVLQQHKSTKVEVVKQKVTETQTLSKVEQKEKILLTDLQKKEKKLREEQKIQQKKANDINNRIARIIAEEIRKAEAKRAAEEKKRLAAEKSKSSGTTTSGSKSTTSNSSALNALTKEEKLISGNFSANQGHLPWPTSNGYISGHFGIQQHPVLKHVETNNKGIYIQTPKGSNARSIFAGVVTQKFMILNSSGVIIQHGNYRTVYVNLSQIYVSVGDKVSAKQDIGKIYTDDENDNKTELYFQIYKDKTLLNPESWLSR